MNDKKNLNDYEREKQELESYKKETNYFGTIEDYYENLNCKSEVVREH